MATRAEYNATRAARKAARQAKQQAAKSARARKREADDKATLQRILDLIDKGTRPLLAIELRKLKGSYQRVAFREAERPDGQLVCIDGAYSRYAPEALSGRA